MASVDDQIRTVASNISDNIDALSDDRALLAQNLLSQLRNLVEAVAVRLHKGDGSVEFDYALTAKAVGWAGTQNKKVNFLYRFHNLLQMSASHYTLEGDASERLMLKYFEYLLRTRTLLTEGLGMSLLGNLEKFPVDLDPSLSVYHEQITERIEADRLAPIGEGKRDRYYVKKVRPVISGVQIFYEVTFTDIDDRMNKSDRIIAFTDIDMTDKYAANLTLVDDAIHILGQVMPITLIREWEVSIRPCEFDNFARIFGQQIKTNSGSPEYRRLMRFLTQTSGSLLNLMDIRDRDYTRIMDYVTERTQKPIIRPALDAARDLIRANGDGQNVLRYLLLEMNNRILKLQYDPESCRLLSGLCLTRSAKPFDLMPFCTSPRGHNPRFWDLAACIDATDRSHELLARRVKNNVDRRGMLYTQVADLAHFADVDLLIDRYNSLVHRNHPGRKLLQDKGQVFLREYEDGTVAIIEKLQEFTDAGVAGYEDAVSRWLDETPLKIDDDAKKTALRSLFAQSRVALMYGAAGTGKSTMVNYIANYFGGNRKLFLAHTNPAKDNLVRKVSAQNTEFRTISSQIYRTGTQPEYDVLVIDECSTVSNSDLLKVLENTSFKLIVLVGDVYQIEAIQFGNWFSIIRSFVPPESVFELVKPFRTDNDELLEFWRKVRHLEDGIEETIARQGYSAVLDPSLFEAQRDDEIILCLNYDGLYGINNVNRFLQSSNTGKSATWGVTTYKVGDPILFSDSERFRPVIFNNLKGRIEGIEVFNDHIQFDVWIDRSVTSIDVDGFNLRWVRDSTVQFDVSLRGSSDEDNDDGNSSVPFQVAYAVSIHKAQGLEYDSVKVVITDANEDDVSHSIFYTAITRTRDRLRIYWTPETQLAVLHRLKETAKSTKDVAILSARRGVAPVS